MNNSTVWSDYGIPNDTSYTVGKIFGYYIIPITALIGALLRIVYAVLLYNSKLMKLTNYVILFYKIINMVFFNLIFIGFQNYSCQICPDRRFSTYPVQFFRLYFMTLVNNVIIFAGCSLEIITSYDRFCILKKIKSDLFKIPIKYIYLSDLIVSAIIIAPFYFANVIKYSIDHDLYYIVKTPLGNTKWYFWYQIIYLLAVRIVTSFILIVLNILNVIEYKKFIQNKSKLNKDIRNTDTLFTRTIITATFLLIFGLLYNIAGFMIIQLNSLQGIDYTAFSNLNIMMSYEIILLFYIMDIFLFFLMDTNLKKQLRKLIFKIK